MKKIFYPLGVVIFLLFFVVMQTNAANLGEQVKGKILLQVEEKGEAWYINPSNLVRYYMGRPDDAFNLMRQLGNGITNNNLMKIPVAEINFGGKDSDGDGLSDMIEDAFGTDSTKVDSDGDGYNDKEEILNGYSPKLAFGNKVVSGDFAKKHLGKIFLQVERNGEAWYVNPEDGKRYFLGRPVDAFNVMKSVGIGITNDNLAKIERANSQSESLVDDDSSEEVNESNDATETSESSSSESSNNLDKVIEILGIIYEDENKNPVNNDRNSDFVSYNAVQLKNYLHINQDSFTGTMDQFCRNLGHAGALAGFYDEQVIRFESNDGSCSGEAELENRFFSDTYLDERTRTYNNDFDSLECERGTQGNHDQKSRKYFKGVTCYSNEISEKLGFKVYNASELKNGLGFQEDAAFSGNVDHFCNELGYDGVVNGVWTYVTKSYENSFDGECSGGYELYELVHPMDYQERGSEFEYDNLFTECVRIGQGSGDQRSYRRFESLTCYKNKGNSNNVLDSFSMNDRDIIDLGYGMDSQYDDLSMNDLCVHLGYKEAAIGSYANRHIDYLTTDGSCSQVSYNDINSFLMDAYVNENRSYENSVTRSTCQNTEYNTDIRSWLHFEELICYK